MINTTPLYLRVEFLGVLKPGMRSFLTSEDCSTLIQALDKAYAALEGIEANANQYNVKDVTLAKQAQQEILELLGGGK